MKICIAASEGGHMTEALFLTPVFAGHSVFLISLNNPRMGGFPYPLYLVPQFDRNPLKLGSVLWKVLKAFRIEKPKVVISTGSEIAIPVFLVAKCLGVRTVFIETITRVERPSLTARLLYPFSDKFYVQNQESLKSFGPKAEFHGGII